MRREDLVDTVWSESRSEGTRAGSFVLCAIHWDLISGQRTESRGHKSSSVAQASWHGLLLWILRSLALG
ncbi:hypothetical protein VTN02DRAFT_5021 [Thermoascus thermophilus]